MEWAARDRVESWVYFVTVGVDGQRLGVERLVVLP